jgi:hypothetical protein
MGFVWILTEHQKSLACVEFATRYCLERNAKKHDRPRKVYYLIDILIKKKVISMTKQT